MSEQPPPIRTVRSIEVYANDFITLHDDEVEWSDGSTGRHVVVGSVDDPPGAVIVPTHEGRLGLVRVYRYPLGRFQWGFPRGAAHSPDPLVTAADELREEMGLTGDLTLLGGLTSNSGLLAETVAVVHAEVTDPDGTPEDTLEVSEIGWFAVREVLDLLGTGEHDDGFTASALALALARGVVRID